VHPTPGTSTDADGSPGPIASRSELLPGEPASVGRARRLVRKALDDAGRAEWAEAAELACSEVVSNAVLHAHTDVQLTIAVTDAGVRVEVHDFSPLLPLQRNYTEQATTGRGMALVAALTSEHGITDVGPGGKTVWFMVTGEPQEQSEDDLLAAWDDAEWDLDELLGDAPLDPGPADATPVRLLGMPPTLWLAARQHHDAIVRELVLYLAEHGPDQPEGLQVDVASTDLARATISTAVVAAVDEAQRQGTASRVLPAGHPGPLPDVPAVLDLELHVPEELRGAFATMQDTLDTAERLAAEGLLLSRPGLPEIVAVRDWACEQVTAQLAGVSPSRWPGADQEHFADEVVDRADEPDLQGWDVAAVRDADRGVVAADDANRIVAVSRPLAELLGWDPDDLVGRRVVALVPPRLREAHVAGFTRHLTTGEAHVLDVPLTLPVLRADGSEVEATFLVQKAPTDHGRTVYLAWIEPAPAG